MPLPVTNEYDSRISREDDGTFTVSLAPWVEKPIRNIPTRELAREIISAVEEAMDALGAP